MPRSDREIEADQGAGHRRDGSADRDCVRPPRPVRIAFPLGDNDFRNFPALVARVYVDLLSR